MTEHTNAPALRFPEFRDEWNQNKLSDVVNVYDGTHQTPKYTNEGIKFLSVENIKTLNSNKYISKEDFIKEFKIHPEYGDILMTRIGDIGTPNIVNLKEPLAYYVSLALLKPININSYFLNSLILSPTVQNELWRKTLHIAFPKKINKNEIAKVLINYPTFNEQEKIGYFFSKLDQQIELEEKKLELLEQQKRGYMQKIFSQQLRFKDENGNDYPEWKKKKLDDVANYRRGSFPQPYGNKEWYDEKNGEPFVQVVDVDKNMKLHDKTKQKISDLAKPKSVKGFKGDIVVTLQGSIGRVAILQYDAYIDRTLLLINSFKIKMNKNYFNYVLYLLFLREKERAPGGTIKTITKAVLSNFEIDIPTLEEQNKIGMFFNEIDNLIELQNNKINHLKQRKQGLLQKMFV
ncbi:type I restriction enzyme, S subunit [Staphylococcus hominis]